MNEALDAAAVQDEAVGNPVPTEQQEQPVLQLTVGQQLAQARNQRELSVEQVAGQLKWSPRQIAEIEAGNYSVFPDMLSVRGFVRSYAKFLKLDPNSLMQEMSGEFEKVPFKPVDRPKLEAPFSATNLPWRHSRNPQKMFGAVLILGLFVVAAFVYRNELSGAVQKWLPVQSQSQSQSQAVDKAPTVTGQEFTPPAQQPQVLAPDPSQPQLQPNSVVEHAESAPVVAAPALPEPSQPEPKSQSVAKASTSDSLVLEFRQTTWLQIKRSDGKIVLEHIYQPGERESVTVDQELNLLIGNAPGVVATLRGRSLPLQTQPGSNVASLSIK